MASYNFSTLKAGYTKLWASMVVRRQADADAAARRLNKSVARYKAVAAHFNCPWEIIAALHEREASGSFAGVLHNGERIIGTGRKTKLVPAGRGPFSTWEEAAIDALTIKDWDKVPEWSIERLCYLAESFNGWGYRAHGVPSAYLWAGSNNYVAGKYVADHVWDANFADPQLGAIVVYQSLKKLSDAKPDLANKPIPKPIEAPAKPQLPPDVEPPAEKATKPALHSTINIAAIGTFFASVGSFLTDWKVVAVITTGALVAFIIWKRNGMPDIHGWFK